MRHGFVRPTLQSLQSANLFGALSEQLSTSGFFVNRRQVLKSGVSGSLLAALGLAGCGMPRLMPGASFLGASVGTPSFGASLISWSGEVNANAELWLEAVRQMHGHGLQRVALISYAFVDPNTAQVSRTSKNGLPAGPTDEVITSAMNEATSLGMDVSVRPWVEIDNVDGAGDWWRGDLSVSTRKLPTFFDSYREYVLELADIAANGSAQRFYIGSELASLSSKEKALPYWHQLIEDCRQVVEDKNCLLSYAANFNEYARVPFWKELDEIGVDAYFKLSKKARARGKGNPPNKVIRRNWLGVLDRLEEFSNRRGRQIFICEWGVVPFDGTTSEPSEQLPSKVADPDEALRAYEVVLASLMESRPLLNGIDFWHWQVDPNEDSNYRIDTNSKVADLIGAAARAIKA